MEGLTVSIVNCSGEDNPKIDFWIVIETFYINILGAHGAGL